MKIGYARVSTKLQGDSMDTQIETLKAEGCEKIFEDTISGAMSSRPRLDNALDYMRDGDVLVVTWLDRLGRTALDTLKAVSGLAERDVPVLILDPELDTSKKTD